MALCAEGVNLFLLLPAKKKERRCRAPRSTHTPTIIIVVCFFLPCASAPRAFCRHTQGTLNKWGAYYPPTHTTHTHALPPSPNRPQPPLTGTLRARLFSEHARPIPSLTHTHRHTQIFGGLSFVGYHVLKRKRGRMTACNSCCDLERRSSGGTDGRRRSAAARQWRRRRS